MKNILLILVLPLMACTDSFNAKQFSELSSNENLEGENANIAPKIACDLHRNGNPNAWRTINSNSSLDTFGGNAKENDLILFDCSNTYDEEGVENISFYIDTNYDVNNPNFSPMPMNGFSLSNLEVGRTTMAVKAVDNSNLERIKTFTMVVECQNALIPALDISQVQISTEAKLNHFTYHIPNSALSGGQDFMFSWDFNGDHDFDNPWTTENTLSNIYSIYVTDGTFNRNVSVKVKNECEVERAFNISSGFVNHNINRNPHSKAEIKPYYYLQSDIYQTPSSNQRTNAQVLVTQYPEDSSYKRIECDYKKTRFDSNASFTMKARNHYKKDSKSVHGHEIRITNIVDTLQSGTQEITSMNLSTVKYLAAELGDALDQEVYDRNSQCEVAMRVIRSESIVPCPDDKRRNADFTESSDVIIILGEFSCPQLKENNSGKTLELENGKFYCEVAPANQCVGGGGSGGTPPPEQ